MQPKQTHYPVFEANQVLTNTHLNQIFDYLDGQERLTRANLIGIGIVCGLDIALDNPAAPGKIHLSKGCGITSAGYLLVEADDVECVAYREYLLPDAVAYPTFIDNAAQAPYPMWELFPAGEPDTTPLTAPAGFLNDKAVVLFLELKQAGLRNCSPNNCDDKGSGVTVQVRRLLLRKPDLDAIIAASANGTELGGADLASMWVERLNLPDLRLPRFDVPNSYAVSSNDVLAAFLQVFSAGNLASALGGALSAAYQAFQPLLQSTYPADPFAGFTARYGFLDTAPTTPQQVRFLPYYYDLFDDLIRAYDEFRWLGVELLCACCPPEHLFPRHLLLGLLYPASEDEAIAYRQSFLASAAIGQCEQRSRDLVQLFQRLVEMVAQFTDTPDLPPQQPGSNVDTQIRITPSTLSKAPLSVKAIPYYYRQTGTPPLYRLWHPEKTRQRRANLNLSYRADEYSPAAPAFVAEPLAYDLEDYNFLRIEGHIGKNVQTVLARLLALKARFRLPIDIVALRTGDFDETVPIDASVEHCRFQDLEAQYGVIREQLLCALVDALVYFYDLPLETASPTTVPAPSQFDVVNRYQPGFLVKPQSLGRAFEDYISDQNGIVPDIEANLMASWIHILPPNDTLVYYSFFYILLLADVLPEPFGELDIDAAETRYQNLLIVVIAIESKREQGIIELEGNTQLLNWEEIDDRLEDLLNACQLDVLKALSDAYQTRLKELKKKQFLSFFLSAHPGIQHKAGVPPGGTFIVIYHQDPPGTAGALAGASDFTAAQTRIDPLAVNAILPDDRRSANLNDFVFRLIDFDFVNFTAGSESTRIPSATAKPATDTIAVDTAPVASARESALSSTRSTLKLGASLLQKSLTETALKRDAILNAVTNTAATSVSGTPVTATANQSVLDTIANLQAQPSTAVNPDLLALLDGLSVLLPAIPTVPIFPGIFATLSSADQIIQTAVDGLADGTVIADFYLPYLCCSDCAPIQYVLPKPPPIFTVTVGCPVFQDDGGVAPVEVTVQQGIPPYRIKIDDQDYLTLENPIFLSPGEHTLVVQDADDAVSSAQTVSIPEPIGIGQAEFTCTEDSSEYVAVVPITGGTPPYAVNDAPIDGAVYTSPPTPSGSAITLHIVDNQLCAFDATLAHECPPPCDLPDQGRSQRCAYRLWLQRNDELFRSYKQTSAISFVFNGKEIELGDSDNFLQMSVDELRQDFHAAITRVVKDLNAVINNALGGNVERLSMVYEPADTDPFDILWIEHFVSDTFSFSFDYGYSKTNSNGNFSVRYGNDDIGLESAYDGVIVTHLDLDNKQTQVPAFDCSTRNQCEQTPFVKVCSGFNLKPSFTNDDFVIFSITDDMPRTGIAAWVWDFSAATDEPFYVGERVTVRWEVVESSIRLTAITDEGCFATNSIGIIL